MDNPLSARDLADMSNPTTNHFRTAVPNRVPDLIQAMQQAEDFLANKGLSPKALYLVILTIEEMGTNIIKYGYDDLHPHVIDLQLELLPQHVVVRLIDDGHAFDPLSAPEPDVIADLSERDPGGLGICLVRKLADGMEYRRQDGRNHLTVRINRSTCA
jgi:anti-sigma regulatory factor (Ser/Thr protein kinase)